MKKLMVFGISLFVLLMASLVSGVRVNEVSPKTPEFIEIYNEQGEILNLSKWKIQDNHDIDEIVCAIENCSLVISYEYFLILGKDTDISEITSASVNYFYVDDTKIGNSLNDEGDKVIFFNSTFSTNFSWNSSSTGKSWQLCDSSWNENEPTPGSVNSCEAPSQNNTTPPEPQIYLEAEWYGDDILNTEDFDIEIKVYNLEDKDYNLRVWIEPEDEDKIISDRYDPKNDEWKSGKYYIDKFFSGPGNKSEDILLRLREEEDDFKGYAVLKAKLENEDYTLERSIKILEPEKNEEDTIDNDADSGSQGDSNIQDTQQETATITGDIIKLGDRSKLQKQESSEEKGIVYESGSEKVKKYAIYGLNAILIVIIILLVKKKV